MAKLQQKEWNSMAYPSTALGRVLRRGLPVPGSHRETFDSMRVVRRKAAPLITTDRTAEEVALLSFSPGRLSM